MKQETRQQLVVFFKENIKKSVEKFAKSNQPTIGIKAHAYANRQNIIGEFVGLKVEFHDDLGPWIDTKMVFPDDDFTQQSHKEVGDIFREVVSNIETDYPKTMVRSKHEYPVKVTNKRYPYWATQSYDYYEGVTYEAHPCKAFNELNDYIYNRFHQRLGWHDLYKVGLFGKRGRYDESGDKNYLCHSTNGCEWVLAELKDSKGDTLGFDNEDEIDTDYSRRYETECYGCRTRTISVNGQNIYW